MSPTRWAFGVATGLLGALTIWLHWLRYPFLRMPVGDGAYYASWGREFAAGLDVPFWYAPGYPVFLGLAQGIGAPGMLPVVVAQLLLLVLTVVVTIGLAERWFNRRAGLLTGFLLCASSGPMFLVTKPLPELLAMTLTVLFLALALEAGGAVLTPEEARRLERLRADGAPRPRATRRENLMAGLTGLTGGLAGVVIPWVGYAVLVSGLALLRSALTGSRGRTPVLWFLLGILIATAPSTLHNARGGAFALVEIGSGFEAWRASSGGSAEAQEESADAGEPLPLELRQARADSLERAELGSTLPAGHRLSWWSFRALRAMSENPGATAGRLFDRLRTAASAAEPDAAGDARLERHRLPWLHLLVVPFPALLLLGLLGLSLAAGLGQGRRGIRASLTPATALLGAALLGLTLSADPPRARLVLVPLLALFGGYALVALDDLWPRQRGRAALLVLGLAAGTALLWRGPAPEDPPATRAAALYLAAGNGFEAAGLDSAAAVAWREALLWDPARSEASLRLSQLALQRRDLAGAIALLESAAGRTPGRFDVRNNLGILYHQALRYDAAERELAAASSLRPREAGPWFYRGLIARRAGNHALADSLYGVSTRCDPRFVGAWIRRVENQLEAGNPALARAWADSAALRGVALPAELARRLAAGERTPAAVGN